MHSIEYKPDKYNYRAHTYLWSKLPLWIIRLGGGESLFGLGTKFVVDPHYMERII